MKALVARHAEFFAAAVLGLAGFALALWLSLPLPYTLGGNIFFATYSGLVMAKMPRMTPKYLHEHARAADLPLFLIFAVTLLIVAVATGALFALINDKGSRSTFALGWALLSIPLGWFAIQVMSAVHYAHLYWVRDGAPAKADGGMRRAGGLDLPGGKDPNGYDFLYFSTTIGMTAQTADIGITSSRMRRAALIHAILSFFFNAVIVAAAVNLAVSLGSP